MNLTVSASPHIRGKDTTRRLMLDVVIALLPSLIAGVLVHGIRAAAVAAVCVCASLLGEWLFRLATRQHCTIPDGSAAVTGLLLALTLPASAPYWLAAVGGLFAAVVVKALCGGLGQNAFNPALGARAMLMLLFPAYLTRFPALGAELPLFGLNAADVVTEATVTSKAVTRAVNAAAAWVTGADVSSGATEWGAEMKNNALKLNFLLVAVVGATCLALLLAGALAPMATLPKFDLTMMLALSLIALTIEAYWGPVPQYPWPTTVVLGGVTFALLPWCAGVAGAVPVWMLGLCGAAVFGISTLLYASIRERIVTGTNSRLAPVGNALLLFLAGQFLMGLL